MPKASRDKLGAKGKVDVVMMDPNDVVLIEDEGDVLYDERVKEPFDEAMVRNIMFAPDGQTPQGVIVPTSGRRNTETGKVEIVAGRRRTRALREANKRFKQAGLPELRLPVWVRRSNDSRAFATLVSENEHRSADSPMNRAKKVQRFIDMGHTSAEAADMMGTSEPTVKNLLGLLEAPAAVRAAVESGKIAASAAYRLARLAPDEARKKVAELVEKAPRVAGRKRNPNAKKAREILGGGNGDRLPAVAKDVAEKIAAWIEATWNDKDWGGAPKEIPRLIRDGAWK